MTKRYNKSLVCRFEAIKQLQFFNPGVILYNRELFCQIEKFQEIAGK
jgi:hypothetical protein